MRKLLPLALGLTALLAACGGPTPTLGSIDLVGNDTTLAVGAPAKVTPTLKDTSGNTMTTTVTYTSSQPDVVAVDAQGNLTVKRLTATDKPVTITATAGGKSATLQVTTYGLELAVGTANSPVNTTPGVFAVTRFRPESGTIPNATITLTAPTGKTDTCSMTASSNTIHICRYVFWSRTEFTVGNYTATITANGVKYNATANLADLNTKLPLPTNVSFTVSGRMITANATPVPGAGLYRATLSNDTTTWGWLKTSLPITMQLDTDIPAGSYSTSLWAYSSNFANPSEVLPAYVNASYQEGKNITVPAP